MFVVVHGCMGAYGHGMGANRWGTRPLKVVSFLVFPSTAAEPLAACLDRAYPPVRIRRIRGGKVKVLEQRKHSHASRQSVSLASYVESEIEAF